MSLTAMVSVPRSVFRHPANRGRRFRAVFRAVAFQVRGRMGRRTITPIGANTRMWAVLHHAASSAVLYANPPDFGEMLAWRKIIGRDDLFVDVGSNVGSYALWAVDCGAEVIAVEPSAAAVKLLNDNLALNDKPPVKVYQCALAGEPGEMWLSEGFDTTNHLLLDGTEGELVEVRTLDDLLGSRVAAGVKIDVEGAERLVLSGAQRALSEGRIKVLQMEWNNLSESILGESRQPIVDMLRGYGYTFCRPTDSGELVSSSELGFGDDIFAIAPSS